MPSREQRPGEALGVPATDGPPALYTLPFIGICLVTLFGFAQNFTLQPILPLLVLDLGGDATFVGIVFLLFSIPSVVLRPFIGRMADHLGSRPVLMLGTAGTALAGPLYFVPSLISLVTLRVAHGMAWAALNTGGPSAMAGIVPPARRGEAAAAFDLMPGLSVLIMPTVALVLYGAFGLAGPLGVATILGVATLLTSIVLVPSGVGGRPGTSSGGGLLEPTAVLPMVYQLLMNSVLSLFVVYPPLYATQHGLPLTDLVIYYPAYGITFIVARVAAGRIVDRVPRVKVMIASAALAGTALLVATLATGIELLTLAGVLYAVANGASTPATIALVMDRAPAGRVGAAMATYTLGFQFGSGLGAALWGVLIDASGFGLPFVAGAILQFGLLAIVVGRRARLAPAAP